ncbi:MAG: tetratricopeptide repeat protein, partial [Pseudomonadota bacterium]
ASAVRASASRASFVADTDAGLIEGTGEDAAEDTDVAPGWAHPSLYPTTWSTLEGSLDAEARDVLGPTLAGRGEEIRFFRAASALSFYETTTTLLEAQVDTPAGPGIRTALIASDSAFYPDGTTAPIYDANEASGLLLDHALAASAYLRFFLSHVGYDEGLALIVEHVDELFWTGAQQPEDIETARRALMPLTVREDPDRDGGWLAEGTISYDGDIYVAEMGISPEGEVSFVNTEVVAEDLPIHAIRFDERMDGLMPEQTDAGSKRLRVLDYERLGLTRIEDFADEASHVIEQSLELPHAVGTPLRARYAALLLSEEAEAAIANYPQLLNRISYDLLLEDESLTEAVDLARRAHEILPGDPYIADTYGWGLLKIGEVESAIILLELAASTANTTEAEILAHLGQAYRTAGRIEEAREALNAALAAEPTQIWADFIARELGRLGDG